MSTTTGIERNLCIVRERIRQAALQCGRDPAGVRLLAVSKTMPGQSVLEAMAAGQHWFGENRAQDLIDKAAAIAGDCEWHFIGHLQKNKVRPVVRAAAWIHAVDSPELLARIDRIAGEEGRRPVVLIEVNVSGEARKFGCSPDAAEALAGEACRCRNLDLRGVMTMPPFGAPEPELHAIFGGLRHLRDRLQESLGVSLPELSMGMSGDFPVAIAEGATIVRVGTAIFGPRG